MAATPGNSNQGDPSRSNDELGGTPGDPGRQGGNGKQAVVAANVVNVESNNAGAVTKVNASVHSSAVSQAAKETGNPGTHGKSKDKGKAKSN